MVHNLFDNRGKCFVYLLENIQYGQKEKMIRRSKMKSYKYIFTGLAFFLTTVLFLGFNFNNNSRYGSVYSPIQQDSSQSYRGGNMMGNGMMGRGMMNGSMMGRGMMNGSGANGSGTANGGSWTAPANANNLTNPLKNIAVASRKGKIIFNAQCFTCHGTDGKGDGPAAVSLNPKPANLTSVRVQKQSDGAIFWKITTGNSPMPSFKYGLSKTQRWELVDFIRALGR